MALPSRVGLAGGLEEARSGREGWRAPLPVLTTPRAVLREVTRRDAPALASALARPEVQRYLPRGPATADAFAAFIRWVRRERRAGRYLCFAVFPRGSTSAAGIFQLWPVEPCYGTAEMGFALAPELWGTGLFAECAAAVVDFAFGSLGAQRLECRSAVPNARAAAALLKLGAVREGTLRSFLPCPAGRLDFGMWSILPADWRRRAARGRRRS